MNGDELLIIFTKAPISGLVKTRMVPHLSLDEAAELQAAFLSDIVALGLSSRSRNTCVAYTPKESHGVLRELLPQPDVELFAQEGEGLGERMKNAFAHAFDKGFGKAVIVGSDIPAMPPEHIDEAFRALDVCDMSLCPTQDGGYCMIGLKADAPDLFDGVSWSTGTVFRDTMMRALTLGLSVRVLDALHDVDTYEDLIEIADAKLPYNTKRALERLIPRLDGGRGRLP